MLKDILHVSGLTFVTMDCLTIPNQVLFMRFYSGLPTASHSKEEKWQGRFEEDSEMPGHKYGLSSIATMTHHLPLVPLPLA